MQTTFKELYELEKDRLVMRPVETDADPPKVQVANELLSPDEELRPWVVDVEALHRGALLEIEVELSAEPIFRMSTVISALVEMMEENEELARAAASTGELDQVAAMSRIIERLLVGLIPIRGRAVDFEVVAADGREWIVHRQTIRELGEDSAGVPRFPLYVVGVAQDALFWKDTRLVLFSKSRYRALCRVSRPGIQTSWAPVKLVEVLADVAPDLAASLGAVTASVVTAVAEGDGESPSTSSDESAMREALLDYGTLIAAHYGCTLSKEEILDAGLPTPAQCASHRTVESRRDAFREMTAFVADRCGLEVEPEVAALYRSTAWMERQPSSSVVNGMSAAALTRSTTKIPDERYLDVEFVAMYW